MSLRYSKAGASAMPPSPPSQGQVSVSHSLTRTTSCPSPALFSPMPVCVPAVAVDYVVCPCFPHSFHMLVNSDSPGPQSNAYRVLEDEDSIDESFPGRTGSRRGVCSCLPLVLVFIQIIRFQIHQSGFKISESERAAKVFIFSFTRGKKSLLDVNSGTFQVS